MLKCYSVHHTKFYPETRVVVVAERLSQAKGLVWQEYASDMCWPSYTDLRANIEHDMSSGDHPLGYMYRTHEVPAEVSKRWIK